MKRLLSLLLLCLCEPALAERVSPEDLAELTRHKGCVNRLEETSVRFNTTANTWLTRPTSAYHVGTNFKALVTEHKRYFKHVREFQNAPMPAPNDLDALIEELESLDRAQEGTLAIAATIAMKEDLYVQSLESIDLGLLEIGEEFEYIKVHCPKIDREVIASAQETVKSWRVQLLRTRDYVVQASNKRRNLLLAAWTARKTALTIQYAERTRLGLEDLQVKIDGVLALDHIYNDFLKWWHDAGATSGVARGLGGRYLQYHAAMEAMQVDLSKIDEFAKKIASLPNQSTQARDTALAAIAEKKSFVQAELERIEDLGWQGQFEKQKKLTERRQQIAARYPQACRDALAQYLAHDLAAIDQVKFRHLEQLYLKQIDLCRTGAGQ